MFAAAMMRGRIAETPATPAATRRSPPDHGAVPPLFPEPTGMLDDVAQSRRVFAFGEHRFSAPIAYLRDDAPMIEVAPHQAVNAEAAVRLGRVQRFALIA